MDYTINGQTIKIEARNARPSECVQDMDPNANLDELRGIVSRVIASEGCEGVPGRPVSQADARRMAELFGALDVWVTRGGFLPSPWALRRA